jgi:DNA-binding NarL/FixJ family response regulator
MSEDEQFQMASESTPSSGSSEQNARTQVFVVDDHPAIREALAASINSKIDMRMIGESETAEQALRQIDRHEPDVVVVDISLEDAHGLDLVEELRSRFEDLRIIVFSMYDENVYAERALRAGASGYLMKSHPTDALVEAIRMANDGDVYLSQKMASRVLGKVAGGSASGPSFPIDELTDREMSVFQMLGQGYSIEDIQDRLNLTRKTIETYRRRAKEKLGFDSVSELLQYAVQWTYGQGTNGKESETAGPPVPADQ